MNVLVGAFREDAEHHREFKRWLDREVAAPQPFGLSEHLLSAFLRVSTNPRVFKLPSPMREALAFCDALRGRPTCHLVTPGPGHWRVFADLCGQSGVTGNLVTDAWFAALAIDSGCAWITADRDYARFPGLSWKSPLP